MIAVYAAAARQIIIDLHQERGEKGLPRQVDRVQPLER